MSKSNEAATSSSTTDDDTVDNIEKSLGIEEEKEVDNIDGGAGATQEKNVKAEDDKKDILKFTMLFNKYNCALDMKRSSRNDDDKKDIKYAMFFNKEVNVRPKAEPPPTVKLTEFKKAGSSEKDPRRFSITRPTRSNVRFHLFTSTTPEPQISEPDMMFSSSLTFSPPNVFDWKAQGRTESLKKNLSKRSPKVDFDSLVQLNVHPGAQMDLRSHNSLTNLSKSNKIGLKGDLKSKIPSLTALDTSLTQQKNGSMRFSYWDHLDDLMLMQSDVDRRLNLQISRSSNDNNRRYSLKFKKEDAASVSDSKLLYADSESKKHFKKCDKKSRGDSSKKEREAGSRKQVQWKTEVDVIYFSTHLAANGDRTEEVIGRVMEPLREEWEQQRKGFYAKMVSSHMESHMKDRFISLLKI